MKIDVNTVAPGQRVVMDLNGETEVEIYNSIPKGAHGEALSNLKRSGLMVVPNVGEGQECPEVGPLDICIDKINSASLASLERRVTDLRFEVEQQDQKIKFLHALVERSVDRFGSAMMTVGRELPRTKYKAVEIVNGLIQMYDLPFEKKP